MEIDILTLFPDFLENFKNWSMINQAIEREALEIRIHNLRNWAVDKHGTVDSRPYGGGPGMVIRPEPIYYALKDLTKKNQNAKKILLSAKGETFNQQKAISLSQQKNLILICGHYEGVDNRVRQHMVDQDISIGNYILSGGELPAMVITDAISRLLPGVLKKDTASEVESFSPGLKNLADKKGKTKNKQELIEYPHYTRPQNFKGWKVPDILLTGDHKKIADWRASQITDKLESNGNGNN